MAAYIRGMATVVTLVVPFLAVFMTALAALIAGFAALARWSDVPALRDARARKIN